MGQSVRGSDSIQSCSQLRNKVFPLLDIRLDLVNQECAYPEKGKMDEHIPDFYGVIPDYLASHKV